MTMAFLPATALASILAVPWDRGAQWVRNLQAILYIVVTLGATVLIFVLWQNGPDWMERLSHRDKEHTRWPTYDNLRRRWFHWHSLSSSDEM